MSPIVRLFYLPEAEDLHKSHNIFMEFIKLIELLIHLDLIVFDAYLRCLG